MYRHTQKGTLTRVLLGGLLAYDLALVIFLRHPAVWFAGAMLAFGLLMFHSLTVTVSRDEVRARFGPGPFGKTIPTGEIVRATAVRNPWYYGWGIRWYPGGWLFNVSGFDAVEIELADGRRYRIGTDRPAELVAAIDEIRR